jgi:Xaa-Pro aminopeptidase
VPDLDRMRGERLAKVRASMADQGVDAMVLLHGPHVTYTTGVVPPAVDVTHATFRRPVAVVTADVDVAAPAPPELDDEMPALAAWLRDAVGDLAGRRVAVDELTGAMRRAGLLDGAELVDAGRVLGPARLTKTDDELACIDLAQRRNCEAMEVARAAAVPGARRSAVAGAFLRRLVELGDTPNLIDPIFDAMPRHRTGGARTSTGHVAFPTGVDDPAFQEGDVVWVDAGIGVHGYASDFGRTWVVGRDPTADEQALFDRWQAVVAAVLDAVRPGATLGDLTRAARAVEPDETPWLPHFYLAHGVGVESAEMPLVGTDLGAAFDDAFVLAPGMVLVLEPVIWRDGVGGYRAEEIVAVTDIGWRLLGGRHHYLPFSA